MFSTSRGERVVEFSFIWAAVKIKEQQDVNSDTWYLYAHHQNPQGTFWLSHTRSKIGFEDCKYLSTHNKQHHGKVLSGNLLFDCQASGPLRIVVKHSNAIFLFYNLSTSPFDSKHFSFRYTPYQFTWLNSLSFHSLSEIKR